MSAVIAPKNSANTSISARVRRRLFSFGCVVSLVIHWLVAELAALSSRSVIQGSTDGAPEDYEFEGQEFEISSGAPDKLLLYNSFFIGSSFATRCRGLTEMRPRRISSHPASSHGHLAPRRGATAPSQG